MLVISVQLLELSFFFSYTMERYVDWSLALLQWTITKLKGGVESYTFVIETAEHTVYIHDDHGDLVGNEIAPPSAWTIKQQDDGTYTSVLTYLLLVH